MDNAEFNLAFKKLQALDSSVQDTSRLYNLLLIYLQSHQPKDPNTSSAWAEVKDLKPYPVNDY